MPQVRWQISFRSSKQSFLIRCLTRLQTYVIQLFGDVVTRNTLSALINRYMLVPISNTFCFGHGSAEVLS